MVRPRFLVIGAGPSGITAAKVLTEHDFNGEKVDVLVVEEGERIGGTFVNKAYAGSNLVSSKYITCYSDFREDEKVADHPSIPEYVNYLERYAENFDLHKYIRFGIKVIDVISSNSVSPVHKTFHKDIKPSNNHQNATQSHLFHGIGSRKHKVILLDINTGKKTIEIFDGVAICSGLHNVPRIPHFDNENCFNGKIFHSSSYKSPFKLSNDKEEREGNVKINKQTSSSIHSPKKDKRGFQKESMTSKNEKEMSKSFFDGKKVLVIGSGETSFDLAHDAAANNATSVAMLTRHGFVSVPANFPGTSLPPLDCLIMNIGTHAYESHWAAKTNFHWWLTTKIQRLGLFAMGGSTYGLNQWAGKRYNMTWDRGNKHIVNKSGKCMGLINRSVKANSPFLMKKLNEYVYSGWDATVEGVGSEEGVKLYHPYKVSHFDPDGKSIHLQHVDTGVIEKVEVDVLVMATGYVQKFPFMENRGSLSPKEAEAHPNFKNEDKDSPLPSEHFILDPNEPTIAYIGFVRPNVGAIPPMAELQTMWWCTRLKHQEVKFYEDHDDTDLSPERARQKARHLRRLRLSGAGGLGDMPGPRSKPYYCLDGSRLSYAVDYGTYMFALAREMECIPSLSKWLFTNPRVFASLAFGQAHAPLFRLEGPYQLKEAQNICAKELLKPILQRPLFMNSAFAVNALFFASVNITASLVSRVWRYTVEDFVADMVDLSYQSREFMDRTKIKCIRGYKLSQFWYNKVYSYLKIHVYHPYFDSDSYNSYDYNGGGGGRKKKRINSEVDWLAAWLVSKKQSQAITTLPDSSMPMNRKSNEGKTPYIYKDQNKERGGGRSYETQQKKRNQNKTKKSEQNKENVRYQNEEEEGGGGGFKSSNTSVDIAESLKLLSKLKEAGHISETEFMTAKKKILFTV